MDKNIAATLSTNQATPKPKSGSPVRPEKSKPRSTINAIVIHTTNIRL